VSNKEPWFWPVMTATILVLGALVVFSAAGAPSPAQACAGRARALGVTRACIEIANCKVDIGDLVAGMKDREYIMANCPKEAVAETLRSLPGPTPGLGT
jgi:hypothetical protein